jgi:hypothetical protein
MGGVRQVLNQPKKYKGNPIIEGDKPWENWCVGTFGRGSILYDEEEKIYKMWYAAYNEHPSARWIAIICYATSSDGVHWKKPELGVVEYEGGKKNNIVFTGERCALNPNVVKDPLDPDPSRKYKLLYLDWDRDHVGKGCGYGLYAAFSPDGIHWTPYEKNPVLIGIEDTHQLMGWDPKIGKWVATIRPDGERVIPPRRIEGRSESEDFIHWTKPTHILVQDDMDPFNIEFYGMPMMQYEDVYLGMLWIFHNDPELEDQTVDTQLTYSVDTLIWQRAGNRKVFLPLGPRGSWDNYMVYPVQPLIVGDEIWIYYAGYNFRHHQYRNAGELQDGRRISACIGLAKLRLDGFVSLDAGDEGGYVVTRPFGVPPPFYVKYTVRVKDAKRLFINAEAKKGEVRIELLDANAEDQVIPGFSREECDRFNGDSVRHTVTWNGGQDLSSLMGKSFKLKFYLRNAKLYSFQLEK